MALNIGASIAGQSFPLPEQERGRQFAFASPAQVVVAGRMGMQEIMDDFEHAPIEGGRIGTDAQDPQTLADSGHEDHEPADLRGMPTGWRDRDENGPGSLMAQDGRPFVAENGGFSGIFLPGRVRVSQLARTIYARPSATAPSAKCCGLHGSDLAQPVLVSSMVG